jgi:hypothetical protein
VGERCVRCMRSSNCVSAVPVTFIPTANLKLCEISIDTEICWHFDGFCRLHFQCRNASSAINNKFAVYLHDLSINSEVGGSMFLRNVGILVPYYKVCLSVCLPERAGATRLRATGVLCVAGVVRGR